jgi:hypothetical protein
VHQILTELEGESLVSQRSLATRLGIALGLTNLLVRRLIRKGWIRAVRIRPNRFRYLLTPTGLAEKARISFIFLQDYVQFYATARDRVRERLSVLALRWPASELGSAAEKRIVFYGAGEVAEIAYVCLQGTDLKLVGVIDRFGSRRLYWRHAFRSPRRNLIRKPGRHSRPPGRLGDCRRTRALAVDTTPYASHFAFSHSLGESRYSCTAPPMPH